MNASRRRVLQALAAAPLALSLRAGAASSPSRLLVLVYLHGGNDGFNTWVPFTDPLYYRVRPNIAVPRERVVAITERHGFHPSLAPLLAAWHAKELAIVQGLGYPGATQQHYRDMEIAFTAADEDIRDEGWVSRALAARSPAAPAIAFDVLDTRAADPMGPFRGERIAAIQWHHARELLTAVPPRDASVVANGPGRVALARMAPLPASTLRTRFPTDPFGEAMRATVELAARDPGLTVVHAALNGLDLDKHHSVDTHWNQLQYHGDALARLAQGLAALREGLAEIGRWNDTLVATYDEFGRSPMENEARGTHHGLSTTHFVLGGRVRGGLVGEAPPVVKMHPIGGPDPVIDTRQLWTTVVREWWASDATAVFGRRYAPLPLLRA